jgi:UDP-N-acetylmuramoyl-tripeptide--D-alanyl-D-alanine ligase
VWRLEEVLKAVDGEPLRVAGEAFSGISTDSRTIRTGELFVPISGPSFDGHRFLRDAREKSQGGCLCERKKQEFCDTIEGTVILVDDTVRALLGLARFRRQRLDGTLLALTGSNGKTTTKELLVDMLGRSSSIAYNRKNFNNLIGVSTAMLDVEGNPDVLVFELGTNSPGEIALLAEATGPDHSLITNVNASHLEGLGDLEGVLKEKLDLFMHTRQGGTIFVNADDENILRSYRSNGHRVLRYAIRNNAADASLVIEKNLGWDGYRCTLKLQGGTIDITTRLLGRHNLYNILAASVMARAAGLAESHIKEAIEDFGIYPMRFQPRTGKGGYIIVDDTYNANPASVASAVRTFEELPCRGRRMMALGDMRELGEKTDYYHREVGTLLKGSKIDRVFLAGEHAQTVYGEVGPLKGEVFESKARLIERLRGIMATDDTLLVKGSRAAHMEEVVEALT